MKLLALDAASDWCSAALWIDGALLDANAHAERGHGDQLLAMVETLLARANMGLGALDAIAFGRGPGAFTGVRLAASITQGLAYSNGLPVIPISDLRALAERILRGAPQGTRALACHDARMGEVYWAAFQSVDGHAMPATDEVVAKPDAMRSSAQAWMVSPDVSVAGTVAGVGTGFAVYPQLAAFAAQLAPLMAEARPRAAEIAMLAAHDGLRAAVAPELAQPVYVRNEVAIAPGAVGA